MTHLASRRNDGRRLEDIRVLVVDDMPDVRDLLVAILTHDGARVTAVGSAEEALAALQEAPPDVLLSDLTMPCRDGYWLIEQVRALPPERGGVTPAAALTANTGPEHRASVLRAGFQIYLEKPNAFDELVEVVAALALKDRAA